MVSETNHKPAMSLPLRPILKLKVDELFLRWLSEDHTQESLRENLRLVSRGESVNSDNNAGFQYHSQSGSPASPLLRIGSPSTPPCSPPPPAATSSPRSPRRKSSSLSRLSNSLSKSQAAKVSVCLFVVCLLFVYYKLLHVTSELNFLGGGNPKDCRTFSSEQNLYWIWILFIRPESK